MSTFVVKTGEKLRVLLDAGGEKFIGGVKKRTPARWADFTKTGSVTVIKKEDVETLKRSANFGVKFFLAKEKIEVEEKKEETKNVKA